MLVDIYGQQSSYNGNGDKGMFMAPISFVRIGYYRYDYGTHYNRAYNGYYWTSSVGSATYGRGIYVGNASLSLQNYKVDKGQGFVVRCVSK